MIAGLSENLNDPMWRLCNLYKIKDAKGRLVRFDPTPEQREVLEDILIRGFRKILILKARQLGMSTVIDLLLADGAIWRGGFQGSIVDEDQKKAGLKLKYKVKLAFDTMPLAIRHLFVVLNANESEFAVRLKKGDLASAVFAGKNARGGTNQILHVSEWGPIQHRDPPRSEEIMTGALPSAKEGLTIIETTWMGGKGGHLWTITESAMTTKPEDMTAEDYLLKFFAWWKDPAYSLEGNFDQVPKDVLEYFAKVEAKLAADGIPHKFTPGQKLWYHKVAMRMGKNRYAEYPSLLEECFMAPIEGAIFADELDALLARGRVVDFDWDRSSPVYTTWDLGSPENTRTIYFQYVGREIHIIDHDTGLDLTPTQRVAHIKAKGYPYGGHFLPHDGAAKEKSGMNYQQQLEDAGLTLISIIPRCPDVWPGITRAREMMPRMYIHKTKCAKLVNSLAAYRTREDKSMAGHQTSVPVHDWSSHDADAFRMIAEADEAGLVVDRRSTRKGKVICPLPGFGDSATWHGIDDDDD